MLAQRISSSYPVLYYTYFESNNQANGVSALLWNVTPAAMESLVLESSNARAL
ncbi:hypothetical protein NPIL_321651, partial [Nephila pilipes]